MCPTMTPLSVSLTFRPAQVRMIVYANILILVEIFTLALFLPVQIVLNEFLQFVDVTNRVQIILHALFATQKAW